MARRHDGARIGCIGWGVLLLFAPMILATVGWVLALPVLAADLMGAQTPPVPVEWWHRAVTVVVSFGAALAADLAVARERRVPFWVYPLRAAVVTVLAVVVAVLVRDLLVPGTGEQPVEWSQTANLQAVAAGLLAALWYGGLRFWARRAPKGWAGPNGTQPRPGEVWLAMVPYRETAQSARHYCVIVRTHAQHAEVLQITSKDKDGRSDHIRMGTEGWNSSGRPCWVEAGRPPRQVRYDDFLNNHPQGPCPPRTWTMIRQRQAAVTAGRS
ncbi:hypothetical protein ACWGB8_05470 [Kitasatospora sp. NPDC054939]